jgi:hypothetical protein
MLRAALVAISARTPAAVWARSTVPLGFGRDIRDPRCRLHALLGGLSYSLPGLSENAGGRFKRIGEDKPAGNRACKSTDKSEHGVRKLKLTCALP